jgi:hypothetical protein
MWMMANPMAFVKARMHNVVIDTWFVIRALFIANFGTLVLLLTVAMCASSYIVLILERPYPHVDQVDAQKNPQISAQMNHMADVLDTCDNPTPP